MICYCERQGQEGCERGGTSAWIDTRSRCDGGSVNVSFEVADVTRPLVAVGELQKRGMIVVMGPHGSAVTRSQVMKPLSSNLDLEHFNGAYCGCV